MPHKFSLCWVAVAVWLLVAVSAEAKNPQPKNSADPTATQTVLQAALAPMIDAHRGTVAVRFEHLVTGDAYAYQADQQMPSASLIKLPVMMAAYEAAARGALSLDERCVFEEADKTPGSGLLSTHLSPGAQLSLRDMIRLMIGWSDNAATNVVIERVGIKAVNDLMDRLGCPHTRLNSLVFKRETSIAPELSAKYGLGVMCPKETVLLLKRLAEDDPFAAGIGKGYGKADAAAVKEMSEEMREHLRACQSTSMAPRLLPDGVVIAHKTGSVADARCDAGIIESPVGPIAYCVMTADNVDQSWSDENEAAKLIAEVTKAAYDRFLKPDGEVEAPRVARVLRMGSDGEMVENLQRTLNRRMKPSPELGVDGDFGPNTVRAVQRFQTNVGLEPSGVVDSEFWKALGPLVLKDDPAPPPEEVNAGPQQRQPADPLSGPPTTTCKAWAIADAESGKVLWGYNEGLTRDPASTTKIMTAYLVTKLAEENADVLSEVITFSERADNTTGSTADVRVGERVSTGELLYGLMLPSGNDASVAFAEHFGNRFPAVEGKPNGGSPYERFVQAMNAAANELGMSGTGYRNTHGLTDEGHVTTAADLVKLAHAAMKYETFRRVVGTPRRGATLGSVDGYQRNTVWNNSNQLLRLEGFYGVKTGTTGPAGACLVAAGQRDDKPLIVVVLGSTSGDARYVDSRNLFRWAWKELNAK
ncbi:serine hydrolase [Botrimarina hoheduenensis]|nr:serine hydrolase [Botrimarina hoheduenensis]